MSALRRAMPPDDDHHRIERFRTIYDAAYADVHAYCRRRTDRDSAADAVAETFTIAWRRLDELPPDATRPWLFGVARRVLANQRRSANRAQRLHLRLVAVGEGRALDDASPDPTGADAEPVVRALSSLSDDDQELLRLIAWEELSHAEVATVLDCSVNAVAIRLHRARKRLDARLTELLDDERKGSRSTGQVSDRRTDETKEDER